jgi:predicted Zn-dependent peptidase
MHYQNREFTLLLSGKVGDAQLKQIENVLQAIALQAPDLSEEFTAEVRQESGTWFSKKEQASQSAIRLGKLMPVKGHADFPELFMANTILGGYFGSRLMSNIREEKGYTYGIGSGLVSYEKAGYWFLSTEVGAEYTQATLKEIEKELYFLTTELIEEEELELVKHYLQGTIMRNFDGAFAAMDRFKSIHTLNLDYRYYDRLIESFKTASAEDLLKIYRKYYNFESMSQLIAGRR